MRYLTPREIQERFIDVHIDDYFVRIDSIEADNYAFYIKLLTEGVGPPLDFGDNGKWVSLATVIKHRPEGTKYIIVDQSSWVTYVDKLPPVCTPDDGFTFGNDEGDFCWFVEDPEKSHITFGWESKHDTWEEPAPFRPCRFKEAGRPIVTLWDLDDPADCADRTLPGGDLKCDSIVWVDPEIVLHHRDWWNHRRLKEMVWQ